MVAPPQSQTRLNLQTASVAVLKLRALPLLLMFGAVSAAQAQESTAYGTSEYGGGWAVPSLDVSQSIIRDVINQRMLDDQVLGRNRASPRNNQAENPSARVAPVASAARLNFAASAQRRSRNYARFIAQSQASNPGATKFYDQMFTTNGYIDRLDASLATKGLKSNNIADAFATYWMSTWLASRGQQSPASAEQAAATKAMAIQMLGNTPSLVSMSDTAKQEVADDLFIKAGLLDGLMAASEGNSEYLKTIAQVARQGAQKWGLNLDAMELRPDGFAFGQ
jgi:hypothetical protein